MPLCILTLAHCFPRFPGGNLRLSGNRTRSWIPKSPCLCNKIKRTPRRPGDTEKQGNRKGRPSGRPFLFCISLCLRAAVVTLLVLQIQAQPELHLSWVVRGRIEQRLLELADVGGLHALEPRKRPGQQVHRPVGGLDDPIGGEAPLGEESVGGG